MNKYAIRRLIFKIIALAGIMIGFIMVCMDTIELTPINLKFIVLKIAGMLLFTLNVNILDIIYMVEERK